MKFYVNEVVGDHRLRSTLGLHDRDMIIGLFKQCATDGRGNFCGYYASEYYIDTELYAYYIADCSGIYRPEARVSELTICSPAIKYHEIQIGTHIWTNVIEAETINDAIELFRDGKWRGWTSRCDEWPVKKSE